MGLFETLGGIVSTGLNAAVQGGVNRKNRKFAEHMYDKQRADALADYQTQTAYNAPQAQMQRYKDAGLNPNLIYGQSMEAPAVRSSTANVPSGDAPNLDLGGEIGKFQQIKLNSVQTNNLEKTNELLTQQINEKIANILNINADTALKGSNKEMVDFNVTQSQKLSDYVVESARLGVTKLGADIKYTLDNNERQALTNAQNLEIGAEQILNMRSNRAQTNAQTTQIRTATENMKKDGVVKDLEAALAKRGVFRNDPLYQRAAAAAVKAYIDDPKGAAKTVKEWADKIANGVLGTIEELFK